MTPAEQPSKTNEKVKWWTKRGAVTLPAYLKSKRVALKEYKKYRVIAPTEEELQTWFNEKKNIAIMMGPLKDGRILVCLDTDELKATELVPPLLGFPNLEELSKYTRVEVHKDNMGKAHIFLIVNTPLDNRSLDTDENVPGVEVRATNKLTVIVADSIHEDGYPYEVLGTEEIAERNDLQNILENFFKEYNADYMNNGIPKKRYDDIFKGTITVTKFDPTKKIPKRARHTTLLPEFCAKVRRNWGNSKEDFVKWALEKNEEWCQIPLPDDEVEHLMSDAYDFVASQIERENKPRIQTGTDEIENELPEKDYAEFAIRTIKKEVKRDDVLIRQTLYTGLSTYTFDPFNLAVLAPTSEGKTYTVMKVMKYFPEEDVWNIGTMSTKALVRQKGVLINSKGQNIQEQVDRLRQELRDTNTVTVKIEERTDTGIEKNNDNEDLSITDKVNVKKAKIRKELDSLLVDAVKLIDLQGKILIFLEPPHHELWDLLKPILSHDKVEISYPYVDRTDRDGFETRNVIVRGWPACIVCSAKDESQWKIWPEIQSRFLITSPHMSKEKVHDGNLLIGQRKSLPNSVQQKIIVSDKERQLAKQCIRYLKDWINRLSHANFLDYEHPNAVWIPYGEILGDILKSEKGTDNRAANRIFTLINIISLTKIHFRPNLVFGKERLVVATLEDLRETLHITQNMSGIPTHKIDFYRNIFMELYKTKDGPDSRYNQEKERWEYEAEIGVTAPQLRDFLKSKTGNTVHTDNIRKSYLAELLNNGWIDEQESRLDRRQKIYIPLVDLAENEDEKIKNYRNQGNFYNSLQYNKIILPKLYNKISENWLKLQILELLKYGNDEGTFRLIDKDDNETCICQFIENYEKTDSLNLYFTKPRYSNYHSEVFGGMKLLDQRREKDEENCRSESHSSNSLFPEGVIPN